MRLFVYECLSAGGMKIGQADSSLLVEGRAMLAALLSDFTKVSRLEVVTIVQNHSDPISSLVEPVPGIGSRLTLYHSRTKGDEPHLFRQLAGEADQSLVIAPECDGLLAQRCHWVKEAGGQLLGPDVHAIELTGDKLQLGRLWKEKGVPTPLCWGIDSSEIAFPVVCKPRFGAGSQATYLLRNPEEWKAWQPKGDWTASTIVQPFLPGTPCSVAFLIGPREQRPLIPCRQLVSEDGRFHYQGGDLPLPESLAGRAIHLARRAISVVPGLRGYVGVDLVLGESPDGKEDQVMEINPRLTTSYVGLRALARTNLAEAMLGIAFGQEVGNLEWRPITVQFWSDGRVVEC